MRSFVAASLAAIMLAAVNLPVAAHEETPEHTYQHLSEVIKKLEDKGYHDFHSIVLKRDVYEIDAVSPKGHHAEIYVDAITGDIQK